MKVFKIIPTKAYCHGCALVAANSEEEAKKLYLEEDEFNDILFDDGKCIVEEIKGLTYDGNDIIILDKLFEE